MLVLLDILELFSGRSHAAPQLLLVYKRCFHTHHMCRVTDGIIQSTLRSAVKGAEATMERIMLVIAHRVDTIYDCDQLLVLADGRLVQSGSPPHLAQVPGHFSQLVQAARANEQSSQHVSEST